MDQLLQQQKQLAASIANLQKFLPYADHGAYGQDKKRISELQQQLAHVNKQIEALKGNA